MKGVFFDVVLAVSTYDNFIIIDLKNRRKKLL